MLKFLAAVVILLSIPMRARADYMLPYPSYMPGNKLYAVSKALDVLNGWWHWGSIGQCKYHMQMSDKYLVEAKTLFEYKQYILALDALARSDKHIALVPRYIEQAREKEKETRDIKVLFMAELEVHKQTVSNLQSDLQKEFIWTPEKQPAQTLLLHDVLSASLKLRSSFNSP